MRCRIHGVDSNETPEFLLKKITDSSHEIIVEDPEGGWLLVIQMLINGVTGYFTCQKLTRSEYEDGDLPRIDLSAEALDWGPSDWDYDPRKVKTMDFSGVVVNEETTEKGPNMVIKQVSVGIGVIDVSSNDNFGLAL